MASRRVNPRRECVIARNLDPNATYNIRLLGDAFLKHEGYYDRPHRSPNTGGRSRLHSNKILPPRNPAQQNPPSICISEAKAEHQQLMEDLPSLRQYFTAGASTRLHRLKALGIISLLVEAVLQISEQGSPGVKHETDFLDRTHINNDGNFLHTQAARGVPTRDDRLKALGIIEVFVSKLLAGLE